MPVLTSVGTRVLWLLACLALVSALAAGWWVQGLRSENAALTARNTALVADLKASLDLREAEQAVAAEHVVKIAILRASTRKSNAKLSTALAQSPRWADERVPDDVARALGM